MNTCAPGKSMHVVGENDGAAVGAAVGAGDGSNDGALDGKQQNKCAYGIPWVGLVGSFVGAFVGTFVGSADGAAVGAVYNEHVISIHYFRSVEIITNYMM